MIDIKNVTTDNYFPVSLEITAPIYWWIQTGIIVDTIQLPDKFRREQFSIEELSEDFIYKSYSGEDDELVPIGVPKWHIDLTLDYLNYYLDEYNKFKSQTATDHLIKLLPSCYNHTCTITLYQSELENLINDWEHSSMEEWKQFVDYAKKLPQWYHLWD